MCILHKLPTIPLMAIIDFLSINELKILLECFELRIKLHNVYKIDFELFNNMLYDCNDTSTLYLLFKQQVGFFKTNFINQFGYLKLNKIIENKLATSVAGEKTNFPQFNFSTDNFKLIIENLIPFDYRKCCYVAGGIFTKYNEHYNSVYPNVFRYLKDKQDIDVYILQSENHYKYIIEYFEKQPNFEFHNGIESSDNDDSNIFLAMKCKYYNLVVNFIFLKNKALSIFDVMKNFDFCFCKIYYEYISNEVYVSFELYHHLLIMSKDEMLKISMRPYVDDSGEFYITNTRFEIRLFKYILKSCIPLTDKMHVQLKLYDRYNLNYTLENHSFFLLNI